MKLEVCDSCGGGDTWIRLRKKRGSSTRLSYGGGQSTTNPTAAMAEIAFKQEYLPIFYPSSFRYCWTIRIPLPGLTSAIYHMSMGNSDLMGGDGWTSSLAEVPIMMGNNGNSGSAPEHVQVLNHTNECQKNMFSTRKVTIAMVDELNSNGSTTVNKVRVSHASDCIMNACIVTFVDNISSYISVPVFQMDLYQNEERVIGIG
ncbi:hypothetical protein Tco_0841008 [Tanacetum coccineum]|uniref:Uncharacterized protein n=1 Tax=Tanacetum coccineum TaxID=301880 RepID=A0ABQ5AV57_9ASTR